MNSKFIKNKRERACSGIAGVRGYKAGAELIKLRGKLGRARAKSAVVIGWLTAHAR